MKYHYIYFALLPVMLFVAFILPFTIDDWDGIREVRNSFDDEFTWIIYTVITLIATTLLLIPNRVTALIGSCIYVLSFGLSVFMNIVLGDSFYREVGLGARMIMVVMLAGMVLGIIHTVKSFRNYHKRPKEHSDVLDDLI